MVLHPKFLKRLQTLSVDSNVIDEYLRDNFRVQHSKYPTNTSLVNTQFQTRTYTHKTLSFTFTEGELHSQPKAGGFRISLQVLLNNKEWALYLTSDNDLERDFAEYVIRNNKAP